jgi:hypothetical protein
VLIVTFVVRWGHGQSADVARPAGTVESFLIAAAVDHDGFTACSYMSFHARDELRSLAPFADASGEATMSLARLRLGNDVVQQESQFKALGYAVRRSGRRAQVRVSGGGGATTFVLTRATPAELRELGPVDEQLRRSDVGYVELWGCD